MTREEIQKQALESALNRKRSGLDISMGVGKTYIGLQYLDTLFKQSGKQGAKFLVVAPKRDIFQSWEDDAQKFGLVYLNHHITYSTYLSLTKHNPADYDVVVLDEAHNTKSNHLEFLDRFNGWILGLTGTPPKWQNSDKGEIMNIYYPIVFSYKVDNAVEHGILNDYSIFVHHLSLSTNKTIKTPQGWFTSEQKQYEWITGQLESAFSDKDKFFRNIQRINFLKQFETKENYIKKILNVIPKEDKCLIFANTTHQADRICANSHHSKRKSDDLERFKKGEITRLSAVEQLSEGVTIPNLKHIIIMHAYGNEKRASQKIGRALRLNPNEISRIHILCYKDTVDENWVKSALESFNKEKIFKAKPI
jgi:superfamily II DNA or RNA helicase